MNLPIQSQPVMRQCSTAAIQSGIYAQGCGFTDWLKCGGEVLKCATCGTNPTCWVSCLGSAYSSCKDCICGVVRVPGIC